MIDTHTHVVALDEERYPLHPTGMTAPWYRDDPCSVERLLALMDEADVSAAVLVQGISAYGFDNRYALHAARAHPDRCTSVVYLDVVAPDAVSMLRHCVDDSGARGLRWVAFGETALTEPADMWDEVDALRIPVVVTILADKLAELDAAIPGLPDIPLALDHCGFADFSQGAPDELVALAAHPNMYLKVSTIALDRMAEHGDVRDGLIELVAHFGADRLMWGSDYSQTHDRPYPELAAWARHAASRLTAEDQDLYLGGTASGLWPELAG